MSNLEPQLIKDQIKICLYQGVLKNDFYWISCNVIMKLL